MEGLVIILAIFAALVALDIAALFWGVDSRSESPDPRAPLAPAGLAIR